MMITEVETFDRWLKENFSPQVTSVRGWEVLPTAQGQLHFVDPDPDAQFENFPVSLCGTALIAKDGVASSIKICSICRVIAHEREQEEGV